MEDSSNAGGLPLQGPHWPYIHSTAPDPDFRPLRLVLQPTGQAVVLKRPCLLVGRHSEADVRLPLPDVSRRHCRFTFANGAWSVRDLNSLNGTFVNDVRVQEAVLQPGDRIRLGGFTFLIEVATSDTVKLSDEEKADSDGVLRSIADALPFDDDNQMRRAS